MRVAIESFRGEAPRLTPRALPDNAAQVAINARLQSGDLETWRGFLEAKQLSNDAATIYLLNGEWLSWETDVDVARGPIPGDTTFRTYLTGPDEYDQPRFTTFAMATTGAEPFPVATRPLGVPGPVSEPTLVIGVDSTPTTFSVDILDEGDELETGALISPPGDGGGLFTRVEQIDTDGNPSPCYKITYDEVHEGSRDPYRYRDFGIGDASIVHASVDVKFIEDAGSHQAALAVATSSTGAGAVVAYRDGSLSIRKATAFGYQNAATLDSVSSPGNAHNTWYTLDATLTQNANGTQTVVARVFQGSAELASVTATGIFTVGGYVGISAASNGDASTRYATLFDNIHVQASGSNGFTPVDLATSYVYTFVNDLGEESVPSAASATIQRPDGVVVTVTTATAIPSGISSEYGIATKRIYRAATGNTGTVFRFVAEINLATESYEDILTDAQLGEVLESEEYDLPPDDMRGIRALPNGVMAGFSKNELCLSAQNRPHAWPVANRLTTDTDIVAIDNIDTTVVIGTQKTPYTANGNDPGAYSMSQPGLPQACVSKLSMRYVNDDVGVVFASPDGLMAMTGPNRVRNVTDGVFTRRQWQALQPETIRAAVHDDIYFFVYGQLSSGSGGMYMLDLKPNGFGLVRLDFLTSAMHSDPLTDKLYMVQTEFSADAMVLFHFQSSEFPSDSNPATDQTGTTWQPGDEFFPDQTLDFTDFKFGTGSLGPVGNPNDAGDGFNRTTDVSFLRPADDPFAVDLWVRVDATVPGLSVSDAIFINMADSLVVGFFEGSLYVQAYNGEDTVRVECGIFGVNDFYHVRVNYSIGVLRVFVDGTQMNPGGEFGGDPIDLSSVSEWSTMQIGRFGDELCDFLKMDELYAVTGTALNGISDFTPPTSEWTTNVNGTSTIYEFDADEATPLPRTWRGKLNLLPQPAAFSVCQVEADDYGDILLRFYGDEVLFHEATVTSAEVFTLPMSNEYDRFEVEIYGTSRVYTIQVAEDVSELT